MDVHVDTDTAPSLDNALEPLLLEVGAVGGLHHAAAVKKAWAAVAALAWPSVVKRWNAALSSELRVQLWQYHGTESVLLTHGKSGSRLQITKISAPATPEEVAASARTKWKNRCWDGRVTLHAGVTYAEWTETVAPASLDTHQLHQPQPQPQPQPLVGLQDLLGLQDPLVQLEPGQVMLYGQQAPMYVGEDVLVFDQRPVVVRKRRPLTVVWDGAAAHLAWAGNAVAIPFATPEEGHVFMDENMPSGERQGRVLPKARQWRAGVLQDQLARAGGARPWLVIASLYVSIYIRHYIVPGWLRSFVRFQLKTCTKK
eukprot:6385496-Prymnesium_polylepis.1